MKRKDKGRLPPFVPVDQEMMNSPAWRATSYGARWLYMHLKRRWSFKQRNNGRLFLSQRDAQEEMGCNHRDSISRWFRELQHYGFIVMTSPGSLGLNGKGKAPTWRLTEAEWPGGRNGDTWMLPTKDYLKWTERNFETIKNRIPAPEAGPGWPRKRGQAWPRKRGQFTEQLAPEARPYAALTVAPEARPYLDKPLGWRVGGVNLGEEESS
jgi:hypothetical protein